MMAGISGYNFGGGALDPRGNRKAWQLGDDNLLIISVGTGSHDHRAKRFKMAAAVDAAYALEGMISDGQQLALTMLQWMSVPSRNWHIDRVCGDLCNDLLGDGAGLKKPLLTFHRYDLALDNKWLLEENLIQSELADKELEAVRDFTNPDTIPWLADVATRASAMQVSTDHFPTAFDLPKPTPQRR